MNAELWQRADKIFQDVVELELTSRSAFVDVACGPDQALRLEVESLLRADSFSWDFIDSPSLELAAPLFADELTQLSPGQTVAHYEIVKLIGKGGMGEVYLARDQILKRDVAVKFLPGDYTLDKGRLRRFQREAQAASALNHPNILTIHQLGEVEEQHFIATEFIEGETLRTHIARGSLSLKKTLDVTIQVAGALAAAHRAGIVHRDIKPENIMLRPDGYVKVLDFGLAKLAAFSDAPLDDSAVERRDVSSGRLMGTVRYMSPEQASGAEIDARSDIFSLGVVMYEMLTGVPPFPAKDNAELVESILQNEPLPLGEFTGGVSQRLENLVAKCLAKKKLDRYPSADELLGDLNFLTDELERGAANSLAGNTTTSKFRYRLAIIFAALIFTSSLIGYAAYRFWRADASANVASPVAQVGTWTARAPISSSRGNAEPAVIDGTLYVAGGWNVCTPFGTLESYDPVNDKWTRHAPMREARGGHAVATLDGLLYAVGGNVNCGVQIASVEAYDPKNDFWVAKASLPTKRQGLVVAATTGKLYAIGGTSDGKFLSANTEFDPKADRWDERAPMPTPRYNSSAVVVNGIVYVIGGSGAVGAESKIEAYDPAADTWTTKASMPTPHNHAAAASIGGRIYVFGGQNRGEVDVYDPATDTWAAAGQMPSPRIYFRSASLNGSIYVAGGFDGTDYVSSVLAFTPQSLAVGDLTSCWKSNSFQTKTPMPTARKNTAAAAMNDLIYVVGGIWDEVGELSYLNTNEAYDPFADKWTKKAPMPTSRALNGTNNAVVDEKLYVIGGNPRGTCTNVNEVYDPATDTWTTKAPMPTARCHVTVIAADDVVYAIGGNTNGPLIATVEVYDPQADSWTSAPPMLTQRMEVAAGLIDGVIYAAGGWNLSGELDTLEAYDLKSGTWTTRTPMSTKRRAIAAAVIDKHLVVFGGTDGRTTLATAEAYDPITDTWKEFPLMSSPRGYHSAVTTSGMLYLFGGGVLPNFRPGLAINDALVVEPCLTKTP